MKRNRRIVDNVLDGFGVLTDARIDRLFALRAVKYEDGSFGIIQNKLSDDGTTIIGAAEIFYDDFNYEKLVAKWDKIKQCKFWNWEDEMPC